MTPRRRPPRCMLDACIPSGPARPHVPCIQRTHGSNVRVVCVWRRWLSRGWIEKKKRMESDGWIGRNVAGRASSHSAPLVEGRNNETAAADGAAVPATKHEASRDLRDPRDPPAAAAAGDPPASGKTKSVTAAALAAAAAWGWKAPTSTTKEDPTSLSSTAFISNEPEVAAETAVKAPREVQEQGPRRKVRIGRRGRCLAHPHAYAYLHTY